MKQNSSGSHCCLLHLFRYHFHQEASFRSPAWVWCVHPLMFLQAPILPHGTPGTWVNGSLGDKGQRLSSN